MTVLWWKFSQYTECGKINFTHTGQYVASYRRVTLFFGTLYLEKCSVPFKYNSVKLHTSNKLILYTHCGQL